MRSKKAEKVIVRLYGIELPGAGNFKILTNYTICIVNITTDYHDVQHTPIYKICHTNTLFIINLNPISTSPECTSTLHTLHYYHFLRLRGKLVYVLTNKS